MGTEQEPKFGLWEDGKRIEWFDMNIAREIQEGKRDFRDFLKRRESIDAFEETASDGRRLGFTFYKPKNFD